MPHAALEHLVRRFAKQTHRGGLLCLTSNGDPALVGAFAALGWSDPYQIETVVLDEAPALEAATMETPERAVMPEPERHLA